VCLTQISHGPVYTTAVTGQCVQPGLQFSALSHNFGVCFVTLPDMPVQSMVLKLTNTDHKDMRFVAVMICIVEEINHTVYKLCVDVAFWLKLY